MYPPFNYFVYLVEDGVSGFDLGRDYLISVVSYATWRRCDQMIPNGSTLLGTVGPGPKDSCVFWQLNPARPAIPGIEKWLQGFSTDFSKNHNRMYEHSEYHRVFEVARNHSDLLRQASFFAMFMGRHGRAASYEPARFAGFLGADHELASRNLRARFFEDLFDIQAAA